VHRVSGVQTGLAMSVHITGGTIGFSLGPLVFAPFVERFGLAWSPLLMVPGLLALAVFVRRVPSTAPLHAREDAGGLAALRPYVRPLGLLYAIVVLRTLASLSFATFMPVMLTRRGLSLAAAGTSVAVYLFASGVGGFLGGPAADRFGARRVIIASLVSSVPFLAIAPALSGWTFVVVLAMGGLFLQSTLPVNVTFGQALAPISAATVSSLMMGFAWGMGGLSVPFVGMLADRIGIERALVTMAFMPLVAALLAMPLPSGKVPHAAPRPANVGFPETAGTDVAE
jgi:FSR family fosmidomycin resistance protein-like MFS transporter